MPLDESTVLKLLELIRKTFPAWKNFEDQAFNDAEIEYKKSASAKAQTLLSKSNLEDLLANGQFDEFLNRVEKVGQDNNLLYRGVPAKGDLGILYDKGLDKESFAGVLFELFYGAEATAKRLDNYLNYLAALHLPSKWTFPTYFLFLLHPDAELFIKPTPISRFLDLIGESDSWDSTPSGAAYGTLLDVAGKIRDALAEYGPRDMIDIHSVLWVTAMGQVRSWKISPGEGARFWSEWRDSGHIAIGAGEFGDLTDVSKAHFDNKRDELLPMHKDWTKAGVGQLWKFTRISEGDRVLANRGKDEVLGFGTVVGAYYYEVGAEYPHRFPVRWDDLRPRSVDEGGWSRTLIELDPAKFEGLLKIPPKRDSGPPKGSGVFSSKCFSLLEDLHHDPTAAFYASHKAELQQYVEDPLQGLLRAVGRSLPKEIRDAMETEKKVFARILKNDYGQGRAWDFYWGAFYPKGGKRTEDAQLFLWINHEHVRFGFYIGTYGSTQRNRFLRNAARNYAVLAARLPDTLARKEYEFGSPDWTSEDPKPTWEQWLKSPADAGIAVAHIIPRDRAVRLNAAEFEHQVLEAYKDLFPMVLLATSDDPMPELESYLEGGDEPDRALPYSLEQLSTETSYAPDTLTAWLKALDRKGQAIIYGPPGTGKTFLAERLAKHLIANSDGVVELVQFHPAYSYEDFIQGIRPQSDGDGQLEYPIVAGRFLQFCRLASSRKGICILIIDEINRANLARVLGELMYLLEYRDKEVPLASGNRLSVPSNVRIIGTMNTADRSIALVDHALRRRFAFIPLIPNYDTLRIYHEKSGLKVDGLIGVLKEVNKLIADPHYEIGISFFLRPQLAAELESIWRMEIEPYLEEFFFDRQQKLAELRWSAIQSRLLA